MNQYAVVSKNEVVNTLLWDGVSDYTPETGTELVMIPEDVKAGIGWGYKNDQWIEPEPQPEVPLTFEDV